MPSYATNADFEAYVEGWVTDDPASLTRLLERATRDVDRLLGARGVRATGDYAGLKLDPTALRSWEAKALSRATCAQAEWIFRNGPAIDAGRRVASSSGPDFSVTYADDAGTGRYSPRLDVELEPISHLRRLTARVG